MPEAHVESISQSECQHLVEFWNVGQVRSICVPETGTINTIRILTTSSGTYVLRIYRHKDRQRIEREHRVVSWVSEKGVPAVSPLKATNGATFIEYEGKFVTVLPFIEGKQVHRDRLAADEIEAMGRFLGDLHHVLKEYPFSNIPAVEIKIDPSKALAKVARLVYFVQSIEDPHPTDEYALQRLKTRQEWLQDRLTDDDDDVNELYTLPFQVVHGDYQESNLFFENGVISAIIDWDKVYTAPAEWEVIRALHLMLGFQPDPSIVFLKAYRERRALSVDDLDIVAHCYGLKRAYDLWLFEEIYDRHKSDTLKLIKGCG